MYNTMVKVATVLLFSASNDVFFGGTEGAECAKVVFTECM
jgi:hypothetical protein